MPYGIKTKKSSPKADNQVARKRHSGGAMAKALGKGANVSGHTATHMKSRMKRY